MAVNGRILLHRGKLACCRRAGALAQAPKANGETVGIQNYASTTGNMHAIIAKEKGFCEKYNFKCEIKTINSTSLGLQALVGKTIDFTQGGADLVGAAVVAGAEVVIVGTSLPANVLSISVRNDVPMPSRDKGYPAIMNDFKGKRIGVAARGSSSEKYFNAMLKDAGLKPEDVTYVAVGAPNTAYTALAIGKQIDAVDHVPAADAALPVQQDLRDGDRHDRRRRTEVARGDDRRQRHLRCAQGDGREQPEADGSVLRGDDGCGRPGSTIRRTSTSWSRSTRRSSRSATWRAPTRCARAGSRA